MTEAKDFFLYTKTNLSERRRIWHPPFILDNLPYASKKFSKLRDFRRFSKCQFSRQNWKTAHRTIKSLCDKSLKKQIKTKKIKHFKISFFGHQLLPQCYTTAYKFCYICCNLINWTYTHRKISVLKPNGKNQEGMQGFVCQLVWTLIKNIACWKYKDITLLLLLIITGISCKFLKNFAVIEFVVQLV